VNKNFVQKFDEFSRRKLIFGKIIFKKSCGKNEKFILKFGKKNIFAKNEKKISAFFRRRDNFFLGVGRGRREAAAAKFEQFSSFIFHFFFRDNRAFFRRVFCGKIEIN